MYRIWFNLVRNAFEFACTIRTKCNLTFALQMQIGFHKPNRTSDSSSASSADVVFVYVVSETQAHARFVLQRRTRDLRKTCTRFERAYRCLPVGNKISPVVLNSKRKENLKIVKSSDCAVHLGGVLQLCMFARGSNIHISFDCTYKGSEKCFHRLNDRRIIIDLAAI